MNPPSATEPVIFTPQDWQLASYDYVLPPEAIAARPAERRDGSKLLVHHIPSGATTHARFADLADHLPAGCTLVLNRSRVFPCRLVGHKTSGGECEAFVLSLLARQDLYQVLLRAGGKRKVGEVFHFGQELSLELVELGEEGTFWVRPSLVREKFLAFLEERAGIPIPPYIRGGVADAQDRQDYQTVYAGESGSVAAPTAGLHFTPELLVELQARGHRIAYVTLHVGLGTFRPVKSSDIREHHMHGENYTVDAASAALIREGNLVAVGTTSLRVLESCWRADGFDFPQEGEFRETRIFLHPGKPVRSIRGLITNFHLPQSSLLMLVSALAGREKTLALYEEALRNGYRFFSYGDAMLLRRD